MPTQPSRVARPRRSRVCVPVERRVPPVWEQHGERLARGLEAPPGKGDVVDGLVRVGPQIGKLLHAHAVQELRGGVDDAERLGVKGVVAVDLRQRERRCVVGVGRRGVFHRRIDARLEVDLLARVGHVLSPLMALDSVSTFTVEASPLTAAYAALSAISMSAVAAFTPAWSTM